MSGEREIILDTETTGLSHKNGDRIVEIGCLELANKLRTGAYFHRFINPGHPIDAGAAAIHGLTLDMLSEHPSFAEIADDFMAFIGDARLVIHNAAFDVGFVNAELVRSGRPAIDADRATCTLQMARQRYPGAPATLDALCNKFKIDRTSRTMHGALLDAELLADVYVEMCGGRQFGMALSADASPVVAPAGPDAPPARIPRPHAPMSTAEIAAHLALLAEMRDPIWNS